MPDFFGFGHSKPAHCITPRQNVCNSFSDGSYIRSYIFRHWLQKKKINYEHTSGVLSMHSDSRSATRRPEDTAMSAPYRTALDNPMSPVWSHLWTLPGREPPRRETPRTTAGRPEFGRPRSRRGHGRRGSRRRRGHAVGPAPSSPDGDICSEEGNGSDWCSECSRRKNGILNYA